ncbi:MAG: type 1 secretion target domain protein, partial [Mastigocladus sp. ERB_26_1]
KPGRDVINVTPSSQGISLSLTETDPKGTGNYLRNIRLVPEAEEKNYQTQVFNPTFVHKTDNYSTLRFMDWMGTNNSKQSDWQNRPTVDSSTYTYFNKGVPVEVMVDLANRTGANAWFNMPHQASDEYMANFAKVVKEKLNPNLKVYVEYSNEVWNGVFGKHQWAQEQGQKLGGDWTDWHSRRTEQMGDIWDKAFGNDSDRVVTVLGAQNGNLQLTDQLIQKVKAYDPNSTVDAIGIAPYLGIFVTPNKQDWTLAESEVESWTKDSDGGLNKVFDYLNKTELPKQLDNISKHSEQAKKYGLDLVGYEGGQHLTGLSGSENNQAITDLFIKAN